MPIKCSVSRKIQCSGQTRIKRQLLLLLILSLSLPPCLTYTHTFTALKKSKKMKRKEHSCFFFFASTSPSVSRQERFEKDSSLKYDLHDRRVPCRSDWNAWSKLSNYGNRGETKRERARRAETAREQKEKVGFSASFRRRGLFARFFPSSSPFPTNTGAR